MNFTVKFTPKKRMIVAIVETALDSSKIGAISDNVSSATLHCFKADMFRLAESIYGVCGIPARVENQTKVTNTSGSSALAVDVVETPNTSVSHEKLTHASSKTKAVTLPSPNSIDWSDFSKTANDLPDDVMSWLFYSLIKGSRFSNRISRRRHSTQVPDALVINLDGKLKRTGFHNSVNDLVAFLISHIPFQDRDGSIKRCVTYIVLYLKTLPAPEKGGKTITTDWVGLFNQYGHPLKNIPNRMLDDAYTADNAVDEVRCRNTPPEETTVIGFTHKDAVKEMDNVPNGSELALKHWPWFFDESGKFNYLQLSRKGDCVGILIRSRMKGKNPRHVLLVRDEYNIRETVSQAYLSGVLGTGLENFPAIEDRLKHIFGAFVTAALIELGIHDEPSPYITFTENDSQDEVIMRLTHPSGRCKVAYIGRTSEGLFWFIHANNKGVGGSIKSRRVRYGADEVEKQIDEIAKEICDKTKIGDNVQQAVIVRNLLTYENRRVISGLV